jgi:hypothetical protein
MPPEGGGRRLLPDPNLQPALLKQLTTWTDAKGISTLRRAGRKLTGEKWAGNALVKSGRSGRQRGAGGMHEKSQDCDHSSWVSGEDNAMMAVCAARTRDCPHDKRRPDRRLTWQKNKPPVPGGGDISGATDVPILHGLQEGREGRADTLRPEEVEDYSPVRSTQSGLGRAERHGPGRYSILRGIHEGNSCKAPPEGGLRRQVAQAPEVRNIRRNSCLLR